MDTITLQLFTHFSTVLFWTKAALPVGTILSNFLKGKETALLLWLGIINTTNISCQWLFKVLSSVILKQNFWSSKNIRSTVSQLFSNILSPLKYYSICNLLLIIVDNHQKLPKSVYKNARMKSHDKLGSESCLVKFHLTIILSCLLSYRLTVKLFQKLQNVGIKFVDKEIEL